MENEKYIKREALKKAIQKEYKIVALSTSGVNICNKELNVSDILKEFGNATDISILDKAGYKLFDFDKIRCYIRLVNLDNADEKLNELEDQKREFDKLENICDDITTSITNFRNKKTATLGKTNIRIIKRCDAEKIESQIMELNTTLESIDLKKIDLLLTIAKATMRYRVETLFNRFNLQLKGTGKSLEMTEQVNKMLNKKFEELPTRDSIVSRLEIDGELIMDISDEFLKLDKFTNVLIEFSDGDEELIKKIEELKTLI